MENREEYTESENFNIFTPKGVLNNESYICRYIAIWLLGVCLITISGYYKENFLCIIVGLVMIWTLTCLDIKRVRDINTGFAGYIVYYIGTFASLIFSPLLFLLICGKTIYLAIKQTTKIKTKDTNIEKENLNLFDPRGILHRKLYIISYITTYILMLTLGHWAEEAHNLGVCTFSSFVAFWILFCLNLKRVRDAKTGFVGYIIYSIITCHFVVSLIFEPIWFIYLSIVKPANTNETKQAAE